MQQRIKVYVAGPITAKDKKKERQNMLNAIAVGDDLLKAGFSPLVPHLSVVWDELYPGHAHEEWIEMDLPWLAAADAVLRMPGPSAGADIEVTYALELGIPVYFNLDDLVKNPPHQDHRFEDKLDEMKALHRKKMQDYGAEGDPYANVRAANEWGVDPWVAAMVRLNDKIRRLQAYVRNGHLANEGAQDSLSDIAVYSLIASILLEEVTEGES